MATDIFCPNADCKHIRESGLCDRSTISLELLPEGAGLECTVYEMETDSLPLVGEEADDGD